MIHRIEVIWQTAMLQGEERAASLIRAPPKSPQLPNSSDTEAGRTHGGDGSRKWTERATPTFTRR